MVNYSEPTLTEEVNFMANIVGDAPTLPELRRIAEDAQARFDVIERDATLFAEDRRARRFELLDSVTARVRDLAARYEAAASEQRESYIREVLPREAPQGADAIRAQWAALDPLEAEALYSEADDATRAALATAPARPWRNGAGVSKLRPIVRPEVVVNDALSRNPDVRARIEAIDAARGNNKFFAGLFARVLRERVARRRQ